MVDCFDHREILRRLREKLTRTTDDSECQRIVKLIEAEEVKASVQNRKPRQTSRTGIFKSEVPTGGPMALSPTAKRRPIGAGHQIHRRRSAPPNLV
jgi:hypothetical protein